ncbi:DUF2442 domain-containing protein [Sphaerotilus sp.]|uniref:DUF2442 domain-containing protein n=1 Tax=Sphaerotilus sp. TaxID=2093942 RepID=UPI002ACD74CC|nr:DUF2442 domain-containing protein [Sphaerotilus sp.]MDZ7857339.1 DUF2442 domain-containing protein [Sphaerotilus sp.]
MDISDQDFETAQQRGAARKASFPAAVSVRFDRRTSRLVVALASGLQLSFLPGDVEGLAQAQPADLTEAEISPSGLGIHFPKLDADIYLPALLEGFLGSRQWMAAQNGRKGGQVSSDAKASAARQNGKLGGRPRKMAGAETA